MSATDRSIEELRPDDISSGKMMGEKLRTILAFSLLALVDLTMKVAGFHRFYRLIKACPRVGKLSCDPVAIDRICRTVDRAAIYYFKRAWCLQRSATTVCLLRLRGVEAHLVVGVQKIPFSAHAWVEVGGKVVNDHPFIVKRYVILERC